MIDLPVKISFYDKDGILDASLTETTTLQIKWDNNGSGDYSAVDEDVYVSKNTGYRIVVEVLTSEISSTTFSHLTENIGLFAEIEVDRVYALNTSASLDAIATEDVDDEELTFTWDAVPGAIEYELKYFFVPSYYSADWLAANPRPKLW